MQARTELFLYLAAEFMGGAFSWPLGSRLRPFEPWGYSDEFDRQVQRLRQRALLEETEERENRDRIHRLTEAGRIAVFGGPEPRARWARPWDQVWRLVAFDMPESRRAERDACRRELRRLKFGCLQGSVWISPDPLSHLRAAMDGAAVNSRRLLLIEGRPAAGESDAEIVRNAWDFAAINRLYARYRKLLEALPDADANLQDLRTQVPAWVRKEFALWKEILAHDPFLPALLLPADYAGMATLAARDAALRRARALVARLTKN